MNSDRSGFSNLVKCTCEIILFFSDQWFRNPLQSMNRHPSSPDGQSVSRLSVIFKCSKMYLRDFFDFFGPMLSDSAPDHESGIANRARPVSVHEKVLSRKPASQKPILWRSKTVWCCNGFNGRTVHRNDPIFFNFLDFFRTSR